MKKNKVVFLIYVIISIAIIVVLSILLVEKKKCKDKESYKKCVCSQTMDKSICQDTDVVQMNYDDGNLTEFTNLKSPSWTKVSPGDIDFPLSEGCPWPNDTVVPTWSAWDFTDFVG